MLEYRGSSHSVQKFIGPIMIGSNVLDAVPCDVKAENISNCNKSRIYFRRWQQAWNTETTGKFGTIHRKIVLLSSSALASVKSTNVNENLAQKIVPGNVNCSRIVSSLSWQRGVVNIQRFSTLQGKMRLKYRPIVSYLQVCVQWNCPCLSSK